MLLRQLFLEQKKQTNRQLATSILVNIVKNSFHQILTPVLFVENSFHSDHIVVQNVMSQLRKIGKPAAVAVKICALSVQNVVKLLSLANIVKIAALVFWSNVLIATKNSHR